MFDTMSDIQNVLNALAEQLEVLHTGPVELIVCGGAAMQTLGYITRRTEDIDIIAHLDEAMAIIRGRPPCPLFAQALRRVQKDFNLSNDWMSDRSRVLVDLGVPEGLLDRAEKRSFRINLIVHFIGRHDQICFKLYAAVDEFGGKHLDDLLAMKPSDGDLVKAAQWCISASPAKGYRKIIRDFLEKTGFSNVAEGL